jgi:hypothetical protein
MFLQNSVPPISTRLFPDLQSRAVLRVGFQRDDKVNFVDASDVELVVAATIARPDEYHARAVELSLPPLRVQKVADNMTVAGGPVSVESVGIDQLAAKMVNGLDQHISNMVEGSSSMVVHSRGLIANTWRLNERDREFLPVAAQSSKLDLFN